MLLMIVDTRLTAENKQTLPTKKVMVGARSFDAARPI
jgi:hypothetical protein